MVDAADAGIQQNLLWKTYGTVVWILYLPIGIIACVLGLIATVVMAITIIGIPFAIVEAKSLSFYLKPVGKVCVPVGAHR